MLKQGGGFGGDKAMGHLPGRARDSGQTLPLSAPLVFLQTGKDSEPRDLVRVWG